jgi:hypothetical protein
MTTLSVVPGLTFLSRLTQIAPPYTRFVFLGAGFRLGLPSHPASRRRSCLRLGVSTTSSSRGLSPPSDRPCRAYSRRRRKRRRRPGVRAGVSLGGARPAHAGPHPARHADQMAHISPPPAQRAAVGLAPDCPARSHRGQTALRASPAIGFAGGDRRQTHDGEAGTRPALAIVRWNARPVSYMSSSACRSRP